MDAKLSTYSATQEHLEQVEQAAAAQPLADTSQTIQIATPSENGTPPVTENGQATPDATIPPVTTPEENVSDFKISFGDETPPSANGEQKKEILPTYNWKDEIKKVDRKELIAELGLDPFAVEIDQHIKGGGQPLDYLQARAIDYNKIPDDALLKDDIRKQYPNLSPSQVDLMFNRKYVAPEDALDEDKEFFNTQMQADAYRVRQSKITEQQKFKISDTPIPQKDEAYEQWKQDKESQSQLFEKSREYFVNHEATKALNESKRVTISLGEGVAPFNFSVDRPDLITQNLTDDGTTWHKLTSTKTGEPDVPKQQLITLFASNPQKVLQDIFNYGVQQGERKKVVEGQNATKPFTKVLPAELNGTGTYSTGTYGSRQRN